MLSTRTSLKFAALALGAVVCFTACGKNKGKVHFGNLEDGAEVESPFTVEMVAENLVVEPAANGVKDGHGHFHILVNTPVIRSMEPVPVTPQHIHYGQGQTEAVLDLPVGEHTLILQFAKGDHRPYDPQITQEIKVRVTRRNAPAGEGMGGEGAGTGAGAPGDASRQGTGEAAENVADSADSANRSVAPIINPSPAMGGGSGTGGGM
jgi:hypothetical protein